MSENEKYIEMYKAVSDLDRDFTKGLGGIAYMAKTNKGDIERLRARVDEMEDEIRQLISKDIEREAREKAEADVRADATGQHNIHKSVEIEEKKTRAELFKARLQFWGPIVVAILTAVLSIVVSALGLGS